MNPFYTTYTYIPFDQIKEADYEPAMLKGIEEEDQEIDPMRPLSRTPSRQWNAAVSCWKRSPPSSSTC